MPPAQGCAGALIHQPLGAVDGQVEVELLGVSGIRPRRLLQPVYVLERKPAVTVRSEEHKPVVAPWVRFVVARRLVTLEVRVPEQRTIELG